mgnify:CR=1 FL=1
MTHGSLAYVGLFFSQRLPESKYLQGELNMTAVFYAWAENLSRYVHVHCLVSGVALPEAVEWHLLQTSTCYR